MIRVIGILAWIAPGYVHFTRCQVNDEGCDRAFAVHRVDALDIVIANGIWQVDMVLLDPLERLDRMGGTFTK